MKILSRWMIGLHFFIGFGAVAGGAAAVINPVSPIGITTEALKSGPFDNFLLPGIFLLVVLGFGNLTAAIFGLHRRPHWAILTGFLGSVLMVWIALQCLILRSIGGLHIVFFILGMIQALLALIFLYRTNQFPINIIREQIEMHSGRR